MDLDNFSPLWGDEPVAVELRDPASRIIKGDDGKPVCLFLLTPDSRALTRARDEIRRKHRDAHPDGKEPSDEAVADFVNRSVAAAITGWSGNFTVKGEAPAYSPEKAAELVGAVPLIKEQVATWLGDRGKVWAALSKRRGSGADGGAASTSAKPAGGAGDKS